MNCSFCQKNNFKIAFKYFKPIKGEVKIDLKGKPYRRKYILCNFCGHFLSQYKFNLRNIYSEEYMESTYGEKILKTFNKIVNLPKKKSDNAQRIKRIEKFVKKKIQKKKINLLDIGSGLGIFPYSVKKIGWNCLALDPDKRATKHINKNLGIKTLNKDFLKINRIENNNFDVITLNKVLEHVEKPIVMLSKVNKFLSKKGFVYIEVPDGSEASKLGKEREEFTIDHIHVFSLNSLSLMAKKAGFNVLKIEKIKEPSTKYTLFAFLQKI
jgi:cyclopropane fatty-acyl-phospholipid synthase-like methyltransferase